MNSRRYLAGKMEYGTIALGLYDPISPSAAQKVLEWVKLCYEALSGRAGYADFYKKTVRLKLLDPTGIPIESWLLEGVWLTEVNFGDMDMTSAEPVTVDLTLRPDRIILEF